VWTRGRCYGGNFQGVGWYGSYEADGGVNSSKKSPGMVITPAIVVVLGGKVFKRVPKFVTETKEGRT